MKTIILVFAFIGAIFGMQAQNTFPNSGNVGIGTTNPQFKLHVHSNSATVPSFMEISGLAAGILFSPNSTGSVYRAAIGLATSNGHYFNTSLSGDLNMRGSIGGRLLFGTMTSSSNFPVRMTISNNGNVGIGTMNPTTNLDVVGNVKLSGVIEMPSFKVNSNGVLKLKNSQDTQYRRALFTKYENYPHIGLTNNELILNYNGDYNVGVKVAGSKLSVENEFFVGGNVRIGQSGSLDTNGYKLAVKGKVLAEELKIRFIRLWPDYVFEDNYDLKPLEELEKEIQELGHLPNVPSAKEVKENGFEVGVMQAKLLEKIEELTLYSIQQQKEIEELKKIVKDLMKNK